jgi:hypothetical protein
MSRHALKQSRLFLLEEQSYKSNTGHNGFWCIFHEGGITHWFKNSDIKRTIYSFYTPTQPISCASKTNFDLSLGPY